MLKLAKVLENREIPMSSKSPTKYAVRCGGMLAHWDISLEYAMLARCGHTIGYDGNDYSLQAGCYIIRSNTDHKEI